MTDECGLDPFVTGKLDPWYKQGLCKRHDKAFDKFKATGQGSNIRTFLNFTGDIIGGMAEGLYQVVSGPLYLLVGGFGGVLRWQQIAGQKKIAREGSDDINSEDAAT